MPPSPGSAVPAYQRIYGDRGYPLVFRSHAYLCLPIRIAPSYYVRSVTVDVILEYAEGYMSCTGVSTGSVGDATRRPERIQFDYVRLRMTLNVLRKFHDPAAIRLA